MQQSKCLAPINTPTPSSCSSRVLRAEPLVAKFASEAALQSGDMDFALGQLKPAVAANPDDWQALSLPRPVPMPNLETGSTATPA